EALEKLILKNMRDLIIKATELKPQVIVMEDLHWTDTSSLELLESLLRLAETQRIAFINVFRPGYEETGDRIVETSKDRYAKQYVEIAVQPLNEQMSETLINNMLDIKGLKYDVINQIVQRADGNPFFIEEVVRSFIDQGAIVQKDGAFEVTDKIENMIIPHTINDVLMTRIDRLDEKTRELVKIASVIGRSFFYRILKEMSKTIGDLDAKLSYLQEIQLFRERKRMEEIEYLFKHALAQEAAYNSILSKMRKDLHLKVANSIESVFKERLHEFYSMLAYHYSKGENLDKAEKYMLKAGEAALSSSASSEALRYYQETLNLYLNKYGKNADPEKLTMVEKNIALALFNKGDLAEALVYFDGALKRWGIKTPKNKIYMLPKLIFDLVKVIFYLYFPGLKSTKEPSTKDNEFFDISYKYNQALVSTNPIRNFAEQIGAIKKILSFDLRKVTNWYYTFFAGSATFCISGLSFRLSKKFLDYGERFVDKNSTRELFAFFFFTSVHNFYSGNPDAFQNYDEFLVDQNLKIGRFADVAVYISLQGWLKAFQGEFKTTKQCLEKLSEIAESFEYEAARVWKLTVGTELFLSSRKLLDAQKCIEKLELFTVKSGMDMIRLQNLGTKAQIQILLEDFKGAEETFVQVDEIIVKQPIVPPSYAGKNLEAKFFINIRLLEESILSKNKSNAAKYRKKTFKNGKKAIRNAKKFPFYYPAVLSRMGLYFWLIGKQKKAVKWWKRSIREGEKLGARPDLARTYMEIGKRFLEEKSKYKELNGITAKEYLAKARTMFQEMDLQWDLDELDKITPAS
ncbi:hypothetical protein ACFL1Z_09145, partial [Thermodesulfobacteriota bacterium]